MTSVKIIQIKRLAMFWLGLTFFLIPGQNYYSTLTNLYQPNKVQAIDVEIPLVADYPVNITQKPGPTLTAQAVVVIDQPSMVPLLLKNENLNLLPASTAKMLTALVAMENYNLDQVLTVNQVADLGQDIKLFKGEQLTVKNLLYAVLVSSANDAAYVLADNFPGGQTAFIKLMNKKAQQLQMTNSYFANSTGLDSDQNGNLLGDFSYTTARDLARLAAIVMEKPLFKEMVGTKQITIIDISGRISHRLYNINLLLGKVEGVMGIKTGWTEDAGECLVGYTQRNGRTIISVVLGSQDRFGETEKLINWVFDNFHWQTLTPSI